MSVTLHFNRLDEWEELRQAASSLEAAARATLETAGGWAEGELSVTFLPENEMCDVNRAFRGTDEATDVIAFDLSDERDLLGDVYVCPSVARRNAKEWGVTPEEELVRLVIHGVLHLLGYDHSEGADRFESEMFRLQEEVLRRLSE
jgi:probable rRNA maturation factor